MCDRFDQRPAQPAEQPERQIQFLRPGESAAGAGWRDLEDSDAHHEGALMSHDPTPGWVVLRDHHRVEKADPREAGERGKPRADLRNGTVTSDRVELSGDHPTLLRR